MAVTSISRFMRIRLITSDGLAAERSNLAKRSIAPGTAAVDGEKLGRLLPVPQLDRISRSKAAKSSNGTEAPTVRAYVPNRMRPATRPG